jgi:hypothetical protein
MLAMYRGTSTILQMLSLTVTEIRTVFLGIEPMKSFFKIVLVIAVLVAVLVYVANKLGSTDDPSGKPAEVVRMTS